MTITTHRLDRIAGASLATAGALFIGVQINHPALTLDFVSSTEFFVRQTAKVVMSVLVLTGITSMFARHARQLGVVGLVGYVLLGIGFLTMFSVETIAGYVFPAIVHTSPDYVLNALTSAVGGTPSDDIGSIQGLLNLSGIGYMFGGLVFGIALFRAGVVARWASALLAVATVSTMALAVLPEVFNRPFAIPTGVALVGIGWSAWRRTATSPQTLPAPLPVARVTGS